MIERDYYRSALRVGCQNLKSVKVHSGDVVGVVSAACAWGGGIAVVVVVVAANECMQWRRDWHGDAYGVVVGAGGDDMAAVCRVRERECV